MTTHEFAKQLLAGPDLLVIVPKVIEYEDDPDDSWADPVITIEGPDLDDKLKVAMISYKSHP